MEGVMVNDKAVEKKEEVCPWSTKPPKPIHGWEFWESSPAPGTLMYISIVEAGWDQQANKNVLEPKHVIVMSESETINTELYGVQ